MFNLAEATQGNVRIEELLKITKSNSGISGPKLMNAHIELGREIGQAINKKLHLLKEETTVVAMLRGGVFFAQGIYEILDCKFDMYYPKHESYKRPKTKYVILVDEVINTGKTLKEMIDEDTIVATCVINEKAVQLFGNNLFIARTSKNSFIGKEIKKQVGKEGPDTTSRLFNLI